MSLCNPSSTPTLPYMNVNVYSCLPAFCLSICRFAVVVVPVVYGGGAAPGFAKRTMNKVFA